MKKILLFLLLLNGLYTYSQPALEWAHDWDGGDIDWFSDMVIDSSGNTYTCGVTTNVVTGQDNLAVVKRNTLGDTVWCSIFDSIPQSWSSKIILDHSGNVIVAGQTQLSSGFAGLVYKLNPAGHLLWCKIITTHSPGSNDTFRDVKCDASDNIYASGTGGTYSDLTIAKLTPGGALLWASTTPPTGNPYLLYSIYTGFDIDATGNSYLAGLFTNDSLSPNDNDYMLNKFDPMGNLVWTRADTNAGDQYYSDVLTHSVICSGNEVYVLQPYPGYIPFCTTVPSVKIVLMDYSASGTQNWRSEYIYPSSVYDYPRTMELGAHGIYIGGTVYQNTTAQYDYLVIKSDYSGNAQWMKKWDNAHNAENLMDLCLDSQDNVYVTGGSFDTNNIPSTSTLMYDTNGNLNWDLSYNPPSNNEAYIIQVDPSYGIFLGGEEEANFMTLKYASPLGIHEKNTASAEGIFLYPNPNNGLFTIRSKDNKEITEFMVYDVYGKTLLQKSSTELSMNFDLSGLSKGCYFYRAMISGGEVRYGNFIKE